MSLPHIDILNKSIKSSGAGLAAYAAGLHCLLLLAFRAAGAAPRLDADAGAGAGAGAGAAPRLDADPRLETVIQSTDADADACLQNKSVCCFGFDQHFRISPQSLSVCQG